MDRKKTLKILDRILGISQQGGFYEDTLFELFCEAYPPNIVLTANQYCEVGPELRKVCAEMYDFWAEECQGMREDRSSEKFFDWANDQIAISKIQRLKHPREDVWDQWEIPGFEKMLLNQQLTELDKEVLFFWQGLDGWSVRTADELAKLDVFYCETSYMERILLRLKRKLRSSPTKFKQFYQKCHKYRTEQIALMTDMDN